MRYRDDRRGATLDGRRSLGCRCRPVVLRVAAHSVLPQRRFRWCRCRGRLPGAIRRRYRGRSTPLDVSSGIRVPAYRYHISRRLANQADGPGGMVTKDGARRGTVAGQYRLMHAAVIGEITLEVCPYIDQFHEVVIPVGDAEALERER